MNMLLTYKIKKIVAEHGYLKRSDLTEYEIAQLGDNKIESDPGYPGLPSNGRQS